MTDNPVKVYFLGSGAISIPVLDGLLRSEEVKLVGVGSQCKIQKDASKPIRTMTTPLIKHCDEIGLEVDKLATVNNEAYHQRFKDSGAEILVVASFGQILKPALLALPQFGCLNVHASLLPKYRGAAPVIAAVLNGDPVTGVTFMEMEAGLDTGGSYEMLELEIEKDETAADLEMRLGELAGQNIGRVIWDIARNGKKPTPQPTEGVSYVGKVKKEDGIVNWDCNAERIVNMIAAYAGWPCVCARIPARNGKSRAIKITKAKCIELNCRGSQPGDILAFGKDGILVACREGALRIEELTPTGGKGCMPACDYLRGSPIPPDCPRMCDFASGD
ncbi:MAG: methionyl-tRNA formyltransferase [Victivallales bacterium]|nr:methionyl-tRNA formyltransferase [Victivallales bacterium]